MRSHVLESLSVSNGTIGILPHVVAERLLVEVSKEMEWLNADIGSLKSALEQAPVVFERIGVDRAADVLHGMVDSLVDVIPIKTLIVECSPLQASVTGGAACASLLPSASTITNIVSISITAFEKTPPQFSRQQGGR